MKKIGKQIGMLLLAAALVVGMAPFFGGQAYAEDGLEYDLGTPANVQFLITTSDRGDITDVEAAWSPVEGADGYKVLMYQADFGDDMEVATYTVRDGSETVVNVTDTVMSQYNGGGDAWHFKVFAYKNDGQESERVQSDTLNICYLWFDPGDHGSYDFIVLLKGTEIAPVVANLVADLYDYDSSTGKYQHDGDTLIAVLSDPPSCFETVGDALASAYWADGPGAYQCTAIDKAEYAYALWESDLCNDGDLHIWEYTVVKGTFTKSGEIQYVCTKCGEVHPVSPGGLAVKNVKVAKTSYTYTGKAIKPAVTVANADGPLEKDYYKLTYSNNTNVGTAKVKVTLQGPYFTGTKTLTYKINPKGTTLKSVAAAKKAATVKWNKQSAKMKTSTISGYQIMLATNSKFTTGKKTVNVAGYSKTSKKVTGLKGGKKYYVKIRTYKTVSGTKYYSPWSKSKTVTTKK